MNKTFSLSLDERIKSKKQIDRLFKGGGAKAMSAYPLRVVYLAEPMGEDESTVAQMMVSVPKRYFKRAVKRNHVKRQVREAYRLNKHILLDALAEDSATNSRRKMSLCFIWTSDQLVSTDVVADMVQNLLTRIAERIASNHKNTPAE